MEESPYMALAAFMEGGEREGLLLGTVTSWPTPERPDRLHRVYLDGNTQEREDLLCSSTLQPYGLADGDRVLAAAIEERQRYILICKVVEL